MTNYWSNKRVALTGGAAMIGVELVSQLQAINPRNLWVIDDYSSGKRENLGNDVYCIETDLRNYKDAKAALRNADIVIHLACAHGGRGFVDNHRLECYQNLGLDSTVFRACAANHVEKVFFMSSACAYPVSVQQDLTSDQKLTEDLIDYHNLQQADGAYGVSKLLGEASLMEYAREGAYEVAIGRGFTVYGARVKQNHAIGALIAKSFVRQDPFEIWGTGTQIRNWTHVSDIARGILLAIEHLKNDVVNLGTEEAHTPNEACEIIWDILKWRPAQIEYQTTKPVGTLNRVADATKAKTLLGWTPQISFKEGIARTLFWFMQNHSVAGVRNSLEKALTER